MNHFPQLTPIENKLKQIYQQSPERSLQEPCDREDVMDVLLASYTITNDNNITKSLTTHIDEQTFILENMDISSELVQLLSTQLVEDFSGHVSGIYEAMNDLLASNGIAAQLRLTIKKSVDISAASSPIRQADEAGQTVHRSGVEPPASGVEVGTGIAALSRADALVDWVLSALSSRQAGDDSGFAVGVPTLADRTAWASAGNSAGGMLRSFFSGKLPHLASGAGATGMFLPNPASDLHESIRSLVHHAAPEASAMLDHEGRVRNLILERRQGLGAKPGCR